MQSLSASAIRTSGNSRSEEHTSELQSPCNLVCRLLLEKNNTTTRQRALRKRHASSDCSQGHAVEVGAEKRSGGGKSWPAYSRTHRRFFFFNDTATTEIYTLSLHDALPI